MPEKPYLPPYRLTDKIIHLIAEISEKAGLVSVNSAIATNPKLRKENQIRSIHSSLAIENNSLSLEQVTDVINGKLVLGPPNEIREVKNAYEAYNIMLTLNPYSIRDILKAHKIIMAGLSKEAGVFRSGSVGIFAGKKLVHMAPKSSFVPELMRNLTNWLKDSDSHP